MLLTTRSMCWLLCTFSLPVQGLLIETVGWWSRQIEQGRRPILLGTNNGKGEKGVKGVGEGKEGIEEWGEVGGMESWEGEGGEGEGRGGREGGGEREGMENGRRWEWRQLATKFMHKVVY